MKRIVLILLLLLNTMVFLGQLWPEGAPPFARTVSILFLAASLAWFVAALLRTFKNR